MGKGRLLAQPPACTTKPLNVAITMGGKASSVLPDHATKSSIRVIDLTRAELTAATHVETTCDSLQVVSFTLANGECRVDHIYTITGSKIPQDVSNLFFQNCCTRFWLSDIKVKGNSGKVYKVSSVRVSVVAAAP